MTKQPTLKQIMEKLEEMDALVRYIARGRVPRKGERIADEVRKRGRMNVHQVIDITSVTRSYALQLMKAVGGQDGFKFICGEKERRIPSCLIYNKSKVLIDQRKRIDQLFKAKDTLTYHDLMKEFGKPLEDVVIIANDYAGTRKECELTNGNKLVLNKVAEVKT